MEQFLLFPAERAVRIALPKLCRCGAAAMAFAERGGRVLAWCTPYWAAGCTPVCEGSDD